MSDRVPKKGRPRIWAYGYQDLAAFLGTSVGAVRAAAAEDRLDPSSFDSIIAYRDMLRSRKTP